MSRAGTRRRVVPVVGAGVVALVLAVSTGSEARDGVPAPLPRGSVSVVGLGDSVMAGTACSCAGIMASYAAREHARHPAGPRIVPVNLGAPGATTADLLADLRRPTARAEVARARVVVLVIGANDLGPQRQAFVGSGCSRSCYAPAIAAMGRRLDRVLGAIDAIRRHSTGPVLVSEYWNVFEDGRQTRATPGGDALVGFGRAVTRLANTAICAAAGRHADRCVDLYHSPLGAGGTPTALLAADGDHPNAAGVEAIADELVAATPRRTFAP